MDSIGDRTCVHFVDMFSHICVKVLLQAYFSPYFILLYFHFVCLFVVFLFCFCF